MRNFIKTAFRFWSRYSVVYEIMAGGLQGPTIFVVHVLLSFLCFFN